MKNLFPDEKLLARKSRARMRRKKDFLKKKKAKKIEKQISAKETNLRRIGIRSKTMCLCSCEMCKNIRRSKWLSGKLKLTLQERKLKNSFDSQLVEI